MSVHSMTRAQLLALPVKNVASLNGEKADIGFMDDDGKFWVAWSDDDGDCRAPDPNTPLHGRHIINNATTAE